MDSVAGHEFALLCAWLLIVFVVIVIVGLVDCRRR